MTRPTPKTIRLLRALRLGWHLIWGVLIAATILDRVTDPTRHRIIQRWSRKILGLLAIEYRLHGHLPDANGPGMVIVSNHVSWLDIWLILAIRPLRFISKADVRAWPIIGWLAERAGTLFLQRERRRHTGDVLRDAAEFLERGDSIGLFPEGTTTDGLSIKPFHPALFQTAVIHRAPVLLMAIRYTLPDGSVDTVPAYHGDISLVDSLRAVLSRRRILADIACLGVLDSHGRTRRELAQAAQAVIATHLNLPAPCMQPETPRDLPSAMPSADRPIDSPCPARHAGCPH